MCLVSLHRFQLTFKPIKVYKIVVERDEQLYSPYQGTRVTKVMCGNFLKTLETLASPYYSFGEGFIHAFLNKEYAKAKNKLLK